MHTLDAARAYRLALEDAPAGTRLHAVGDAGVPFREIAETIGRMLGLPAASIAPENVAEHFSYLAGFIELDNPTSSELTRQLLGWEPNHIGLIADLEDGHYFDGGVRRGLPRDRCLGPTTDAARARCPSMGPGAGGNRRPTIR